VHDGHKVLMAALQAEPPLKTTEVGLKRCTFQITSSI